MAITRDILSGYLAKSGGMVESVDGSVHTVTNSYESDRNVLSRKQNKDKAATPVTISDFTYAVDALGQRTGQTTAGSAFSSGFVRSFGYDAKGQVTKDDHSVNNTFDRTYGFDGIGNRTTATEDTTTVSYTANGKNQYSSVGGTTQTHDADGNLTDDGTYKYVYDAENRLIKTTNQSNVTLGLYGYDYLSRRITRFKATSSQTFGYVYDGWNLIAEYTVQTSSIVLNKTFTWGKDLSGSMQGAGGVGGLLSIKQGLTSYYPTYDGNGNISEYIQSTDGSVVAHYEYDAFGRSLVVSGSKAGWFGYRFSTKRINTECGLYYYGYRYYAPETGRWINRDPIEEDGGLNIYGFVGNDGVNYWDYLGLQGIPDVPDPGQLPDIGIGDAFGEDGAFGDDPFAPKPEKPEKPIEGILFPNKPDPNAPAAPDKVWVVEMKLSVKYLLDCECLKEKTGEVRNGVHIYILQASGLAEDMNFNDAMDDALDSAVENINKLSPSAPAECWKKLGNPKQEILQKYQKLLKKPAPPAA